ncbi:MAG: YdbH domain-containing protein [Marinobacter sp.]|uniref:intermembrane phospholipid transport protein YdbH family protein n=1 Tax=Marinobacter sp. TaxID=50741 RepID=UPI0034A02F1F
MSRRCAIGLTMLALVLAAVAAGGFYLVQSWQQFKHVHGVQSLEWEELALSFSELKVGRIEVLQRQPDKQLRVRANALSLSWHWQWSGPRPIKLSVGALDIDWQTENKTTVKSEPEQPLELSRLPWRWLPYELAINSFHATVPCAEGRCALNGALKATRGPDLLPVIALLELEHQQHLVQVETHLDGQSRDDLSLTATVSIDGETHAEMISRYRTATEHQQTEWSGSVRVPELPQADWLLAWLQTWHPMQVGELPPQPDSASMMANWEMAGPAGPDFFQNLSGNLTVSANLPQPWPVPGVAVAQGRIELALSATHGHWRAKTVNADLTLEKPGDWAQQLPEFLQPHTLDIRIRPEDEVSDLPPSDRFIALNLAVSSRGLSKIDIDSQLAVATAKPWAVQVGETRIEASLQTLNAGDWALREVNLGLSVSGQVDEQEMTLELGPGSTLNIRNVSNLEPDNPFELDQVSADLKQLEVIAGYNPEEKEFELLSLKGPLSLGSAEVTQPILHSQAWRFEGLLNSGSRHLNLEGTVDSKAGTSADIDLAYPFGGDLTMTANLSMEGETSAQAWSDTLAIWPQSLHITEGKLTADANLELPASGPTELEAQLVMTDVSGVFDRTAWTALEGSFDVGLRGSELAVTIPKLTLEQVNPGVLLGPVVLGGSYRAPRSDVSGGELTLSRANAGFLGGFVKVSPATWDLGNLPLRVPLELSQLELAELMSAYPAQGLSGTGTLTGQVPLVIDRQGIRVEQGKVTAVEPGGTLSLPADRLRGIAQGNQAMELVASAMENFHYTVLRSTIDYDQDGTLFLGLHLEGNNPDVRDGYPIELNINLEEDVPALLTSLQLSGRVNEAVTERVRELVQERNALQGEAKTED